MEGWQTRQLRELADIRISNVDKKFYASEKPVKLCNYMDVYANEYVTDNMQFMEASATPAEIERFSLNRGDVIITKDSETPDDIGIPAVITEEINDLVCGYHLALIRPNQEYLNPVYLAKQLCTSDMVRYFAIKASGSTRFGLSIGAIETVEIPTPPKPEQTKIAEILSTVDRAIEQTEAIITKQQRIKTGLMQDLLTRGIDEHGNIRSEEAHEFKDSPLGRIPVGWEVRSLGEASHEIIDCPHTTPCFVGDGVFVVRTFNAKDGRIAGNRSFVSEKEYVERISRLEPHANDVILTREAPVGEAFIVPDGLRMCLGQRTMLVRCNKWECHPGFLVETIYSEAMRLRFDRMVGGTTNPHLNVGDVRNLQLALPPIAEQELIQSALAAMRSSIEFEAGAVTKLQALKTGIMQDLLTGKVRVTPLLNEPKEDV